MVVCKDKATESWAAEPIRVGVSVHTSMVVFPLVLGPGNVPAEIGLGDTRARALWRHLMATYTPRFPGSGTLIEETLIEGEAKGRAEGRAEDILRILDLRGIEVADVDRERITACADLETLGTWFDRAVTAASGQELFADE
ncbi:hypothetical protein [Streptomyces sp. NPDC004270]